jgi:hypothetical protein
MNQKYAHTDDKGLVIGFYMDGWHSPEQIPGDAIQITDEQHQELVLGQSDGKHLYVYDDGKHELKDPPPPTKDQVERSIDNERKIALTSTDWLIARHQEETLIGDDITLNKDQFKQLTTYRKALRDLPTIDKYPYVDLPQVPEFIANQKQ